MIKLFPEEPQDRISERIHEQTVDQPGDQARRDTADFLHRQSCRHAGGDAVPGPSKSDFVEDCGSPAGAVRRDNCGGTCDHADHADHAVDATAGPSDSRCADDRGRPECAVHQQSCGGACDHADAPVPPAAANNTFQEHISEQAQIVDEPQTMEEPLESMQRILAECAADPAPQFEVQTVEVVKTNPQERFSKRTRANRRRATAARWNGAMTVRVKSSCCTRESSGQREGFDYHLTLDM